ncbi:hypothetical protein DV515_00012556 [Chloebia gouldiae]|uniref:Uncharacterized protein n=1 Tax=Chloebia gouldiae TaxID=44316 RepID=A0A3L8S3D1_CHLGU|nr:hypothetical protein DV515_00012556 [Chloebia gouldiae]
MVEIFQKQIDNMTQIMGQHGQTAGAMEVEKSQLKKEINDWKLKAEELNAFEDLKRNYQGEVKEMENAANRVKMQLKSAQAELKQARTALKTTEGPNGNDNSIELLKNHTYLSYQLENNSLEAATRMQKQITAKRGQIDALQSKIKFLEEAMANTAKEKHYLREENSKLNQKLSCIRAENIRIAGDLEILRSQDKQLKEKLSKTETALDKKPTKLDILKEKPLQDLKRILQELTSSDSEVPSMDLSSHVMSPMIRTQKVKTKKSKEKERKLFK